MCVCNTSKLQFFSIRIWLFLFWYFILNFRRSVFSTDNVQTIWYLKQFIKCFIFYSVQLNNCAAMIDEKFSTLVELGGTRCSSGNSAKGIEYMPQTLMLIIPISVLPNAVDLRYFKLRILLEQIVYKFVVSKVYFIR